MSDTNEVLHAADAPANEPKKPQMVTHDYTTHVGPNERGLHDAAVHTQKPADGDEGREVGLLPAHTTED